MTKKTDIVEQTFPSKGSPAFLGPNIPQSKTASETIRDIVKKVESLYDKIDQEITNPVAEECIANDAKIEIWSREIERLCRKIEMTPIQNSLDLKAKISLHLSLISKSFLDMRSIEMHSDKIMDILEEYESILPQIGLRLVQ